MTAAIYIRKSRKDGDKPAHRLTVQREQLPAYAHAQGWECQVYDDGHASAARGKIEDLQERARLESDIRAGKIDTILTIELSRLSRDDSLQDYVAWLHMCGEHGVKLATMSRILDPGQHSDWMLLLMEGGFSSVEMKVLHARMKEGRDQARNSGKYLGGQVPPPYVYDRAAGMPVIDPVSLRKMKQIWEMAETMSARKIATQLGLAPISVRRAISDDRLLYYQALRINPDGGDYIICEWEPCMDAAQAERIRTARRSGHRGYNRNMAASLLSNLGIVFCGYCGRSIRAWKSTTRSNGKMNLAYYGCKANETARLCAKSRMIQQSILDERIATNLLGTLDNLDELIEFWQTAQGSRDATEKIEALDRHETLLNTKKQRLVAAVADGVLDFADAKEKRQEIERDLDLVRKERATLKVTTLMEPDWQSMGITRVDWATMDLDEKREAVSACIRQIRVFANYAIIDYAFPRAADGDTLARVHLPSPAKNSGKSTKCTTSELLDNS